MRLKTGLILATLVLATGVTAALAADAFDLGARPPRTVPPAETLPPPGTGPVTPPAGRVLVPAPIERLDVRIAESAPPQYFVEITAGLPNGCARQAHHEVSRSGDVFTVRVLNSIPSGDAICTMIYGTYKLNIALVHDLRPGVTYTVVANDRTTTFTAR